MIHYLGIIFHAIGSISVSHSCLHTVIRAIRSSSDCILSMISYGEEENVNSVRVSHPNKADYREHLLNTYIIGSVLLKLNKHNPNCPVCGF